MSPRHGAPDTVRPKGTTREDLRRLVRLAPYLWPKDALGLRLRVVGAIAFLVAAKLINVYVPILYKTAVDALSAPDVLVLPIALVLGYGLARVGAQTFTELREAIFSRVEQHAVRLVGLSTFRHLHSLSLRFHLERQTGGMSRAIERGIRGVEFLLSFMLFNLVPTLFEILLVCGVLWHF